MSALDHPEATGALMRFTLALAVLAALPLSAQAPNPNGPIPSPAAKYKITIQKDAMVSMRDGVRLATDIYRPEGAGDRLPVILMRTPYNKATYGGATAPAAFFAGQGYAVVTQTSAGNTDRKDSIGSNWPTPATGTTPSTGSSSNRGPPPALEPTAAPTSAKSSTCCRRTATPPSRP